MTSPQQFLDHLHTLGAIARVCDIPPYTARTIVLNHNVRHVARIGNWRLFDDDGLEAVRQHVLRIKAKRLPRGEPLTVL